MGSINELEELPRQHGLLRTLGRYPPETPPEKARAPELDERAIIKNTGQAHSVWLRKREQAPRTPYAGARFKRSRTARSVWSASSLLALCRERKHLANTFDRIAHNSLLGFEFRFAGMPVQAKVDSC